MSAGFSHVYNFNTATFKLRYAAVFLLLFFLLSFESLAQTTFFSFGSTWKYLDNGSNQGTAWRASGFDDSSWASGASKLGYGDGDEVTILNACGTPTQFPSCSNKYITYYFRKTINISDVSLYASFTFEMYRDDGVVVYVNGTEAFRNNMPAGTIINTTPATTGTEANAIVTQSVSSSFFQTGVNTIAVEVHQSSGSSSDVAWNLKLSGVSTDPTQITIGPYLQMTTSSSIMLRWYTDLATDSKVSYGTNPDNLSLSVTVSGTRTNHTVHLTGLNTYTKYYYSIGTSTSIIQSGVDNYFLTSPNSGATDKYTFWVVGDAGNNSSRQRNVRDEFLSYMGDTPINGWILLGDNAYTNGTTTAYTDNFFGVYETDVTKKAPLWPATGNHEYANNSARQRDHNVPYFDFFDLPTGAEAGGVASGTEAYYSFDYGNIHFVALDSYIIETVSGTEFRLYDTLGTQIQWLKQDLAANNKDWTIVYFHHPPYTKGSHNSDTETELINIRQNVVRILERYDVDLVLTGHSHTYERSKLMKGHWGFESSLDPLVHHLSQSSGTYQNTTTCLYVKDSPVSQGGTVYAVSGSAGQLDPGEPDFPHNAMAYGNDAVGGSMILEIEDNRLDAKWLSANGDILDQFTLMKRVNQTSSATINEGESVDLTASWIGQYQWQSPLSGSSQTLTVTPAVQGSYQYTVKDQHSCITDVFNVTVLPPLPVELVSFKAKAEEDRVSLTWKTASELNNDFFEVQRFVDLENIESIGKVKGHGTTSLPHTYQFNDFYPLQGKSYYRLKQVDFDGKFEFSDIVQVTVDLHEYFSIYPNPGDGTQMNLSVRSYSGPALISVYDMRGALIKSAAQTIEPGESYSITFDYALQPGLYSVLIRSNSGMITRKWLVK